MNKSLKIAYIIHTLGFAGAEKHLLLLLPGLKKMNVVIRLFIISKHSSLNSLQKFFDQLEIEKIPYTVYYRRSRLDFLMIARKIAMQLRQGQFTLLHSHLFNADIVAVLIKKLFYRKLVLISTKHGYDETELYNYSLNNRRINKNLYYYIFKYLIKNIDYNIVVSESLSDFFYTSHLTPERMPVIHHGLNPIDTTGFKTKESSPKIITVGRLSEIKGHIYMLRAMPEIIRKVPGVRWLILGDGPLKNQLIEEAGRLEVIDHVDFLGFGDPLNYFPACCLMVVPSVYESFGFVYIEAFAAKIPLVAFDSGAAREIIRNEENGLLVPVGDTRILARKIIYLLKNPEVRRQLSEKGYQDFIDHYSVESMVKNTLDFYKIIPER